MSSYLHILIRKVDGQDDIGRFISRTLLPKALVDENRDELKSTEVLFHLKCGATIIVILQFRIFDRISDYLIEYQTI